MQLSDKKLSKKTRQKLFFRLYQVLADLNSPQEVESFLDSVLTPTEQTAVAKRLAIAWHLKNNRSYDEIMQIVKVSSATIASVQKMLESESFKLALKKIEADIWAEKTSKKISQALGQISSWFKPQS